MLDQIVSARNRSLSLPENILGRVVRKESMEILPHLKRIKSSPQASAPLCLIENPSFRHLHKCSSHSKLPHLDVRYKRLSCPNNFGWSSDRKQNFKECDLRRTNSYPKTRVKPSVDSKSSKSNDRVSTILEKAQVQPTHDKGPLPVELLSATTAKHSAGTESKKTLLPGKCFLLNSMMDRMETRALQKAECLQDSQTEHDSSNMCNRVNKAEEDASEKVDQATKCSPGDSYKDILYERLIKASSHVSTKSSLRSITE